MAARPFESLLDGTFAFPGELDGEQITNMDGLWIRYLGLASPCPAAPDGATRHRGSAAVAQCYATPPPLERAPGGLDVTSARVSGLERMRVPIGEEEDLDCPGAHRRLKLE